MRTQNHASLGRCLIAAVLTLVCASACKPQPQDPFTLDRNMLTIDNRSPQDWRDVEIWINSYYRIAVPSIPAGSRFQSPLDVAVSGFGQRFDFKRAQLKDIRLTAKNADGKPIELKKQFEMSGLAGALGGKR